MDKYSSYHGFGLKAFEESQVIVRQTFDAIKGLGTELL
jgi:hypothetical protein